MAATPTGFAYGREKGVRKSDEPSKKAKYFESLHKKGAPILLYNAWDSGSAVTIQAAGAKAIASSSWSVANAQGYEDGEQIPRELVEQIVARISATVDVPVTVDFEGATATTTKSWP